MEEAETGLNLLLPVILDTVFIAFTPAVLVSIIILIVLLLCSALISGSEIAFFSIDPPQLQEIRNQKSRKDRSILRVLERPKRLLATILISNNFLNVAIVILSTYITAALFYLDKFPVLIFIIQILVVASLILIFGEIIPKVYATQYPVKFARIMVIPLQFLIRLFYPLSSFLVVSTNFIDRRMVKKNPKFSMDELSEAIDIATEKETTQDEKKILKGIVQFGDIEVREIMKSRTDITAVNEEISLKDLLDLILEAGYSRIPVFRENFDHISGILYIKDLLPHLGSDKDFDWKNLIRPAFFVPENKKINDLLKEIQEKKIHLAIVVDEYGGTSGIVTLEDILEEIVGEISDEFDMEDDEIPYTKIDADHYIFEGKTSLNDLCKILDIHPDTFDDVKGDSDSIAGLILELKGKIPAREENITFGQFVFKIIAVDHRRIKKIKVSINNDESEK